MNCISVKSVKSKIIFLCLQGSMPLVNKQLPIDTNGAGCRLKSGLDVHRSAQPKDLCYVAMFVPWGYSKSRILYSYVSPDSVDWSVLYQNIVLSEVIVLFLMYLDLDSFFTLNTEFLQGEVFLSNVRNGIFLFKRNKDYDVKVLLNLSIFFCFVVLFKNIQFYTVKILRYFLQYCLKYKCAFCEWLKWKLYM